MVVSGGWVAMVLGNGVVVRVALWLQVVVGLWWLVVDWVEVYGGACRLGGNKWRRVVFFDCGWLGCKGFGCGRVAVG